MLAIPICIHTKWNLTLGHTSVTTFLLPNHFLVRKFGSDSYCHKRKWMQRSLNKTNYFSNTTPVSNMSSKDRR